MSEVIMPPSRFSWRSEPTWVRRARAVFEDLDRRSGNTTLKPDALRDPAADDRWLRRFMLGQAATNMGFRRPISYLRIAERHLAVLERAGVPMPDRTHHIDYEAGILYSSVQSLPGERASFADLVKTPTGLSVVRSIFRAHLAYQEWAVVEGYPYVLEDKMPSKQYLQDGASGPLQLVDVGPELLDRKNPGDWSWIAGQGRVLAAMGDLVGEPLKTNPLSQRLP